MLRPLPRPMRRMKQIRPQLRRSRSARIEGEAGILSLSIERPGLHDAFVAIAGEAAAQALTEEKET